MVDWVYKKDGTLIKDYGKEEEKKAAEAKKPGQ